MLDWLAIMFAFWVVLVLFVGLAVWLIPDPPLADWGHVCEGEAEE